jgi:hypothetical protein
MDGFLLNQLDFRDHVPISLLKKFQGKGQGKKLTGHGVGLSGGAAIFPRSLEFIRGSKTESSLCAA